MKGFDDWLLEGSGCDHSDEVQESADEHGLTYDEAERKLEDQAAEDEAERRWEEKQYGN